MLSATGTYGGKTLWRDSQSPRGIAAPLALDDRKPLDR